MKPDVFLCKSHPDFHLPAEVEVGVGFDGEAYARRLKECGADAVAIFGKCHYGHSYYYTDIGYRHPKLRKDMVAEVVRGAKKAGIGVVAYYSVFLDTAAIRQHPEWRLRATSDAVDAGFDSGNFLPVCVNSGYLRELLIPQSVEIVSKYDVDELLFDTMTGFRPCYCTACKAKFGAEIPAVPKDAAGGGAGGTGAEWLRYVKWYSACYEDFYAEAAKAVAAANPKVKVQFNWEWSYRRPAPPAKNIGRLTADLISTGTVASLVTRYYAGVGLPFDYMTGRFMHGLGDWNSNTPESLLYTAAATVGNGGSFYIIDRGFPDGSLQEQAYEMMKCVFGFVQERRQWLVGARPVAEVAALHSYASVMGDQLQFFPDAKARAERIQPYEGLTRMFIEHGRHFTALNEERLRQTLGEFQVVILPEQEYLSPQTKQSLRAFVENGGEVILSLSGREAGVDQELMALAGVDFGGWREGDYGYLGTQPPLLLRGRSARLEPKKGTEVVLERVAPLAAGGARKFGHGYAPPEGGTGEAAITSRRLGRGEVVCIALPFFKAYFDHQNIYQAELFCRILDRVLPQPVVRLRTEAQVELCVMRRGDDLVVHVVNHSGRERLGNYHYPVTRYLPEIRGIEVEIRLKSPPSPAATQALSVPDRQPLDGHRQGGYVRVGLPPLKVMQSLCVPGYFA